MKGMICRYAFDEGGHPLREYLCRDEALFAECEWSWSREAERAYHFPSFHEAGEARPQHACQDAKGEAYLLFALPVTEPGPEAEPEPILTRQQRERERELPAVPKVDKRHVWPRGQSMPKPADDVYEETRRRLGESDD